MTKLPAPPLGNHRLKIVEYNGVRRPVLYKRRRRDDNDDNDDDDGNNDENPDNNDDDDDDSNPYRGIQLEEILAPSPIPQTCPTTSLWHEQ